jgi:rhodanese-related sulfurtransferase
MLKKVTIIFAAVTLLTTPAFGADPLTPEQLFKKNIGIVKKQIKSINAATLESWIKEDNDFTLVDVREAGEVAAAKISADEFMAIPRGVIEVKLSRKIKELDTTLVIYCLKGGRGAMTTKTLTDLGYTNVYNLDGGILNWIKEGKTVSNMFGSLNMQNYVSNYK